MPCYKTGDTVPNFHVGAIGQTYATEEDCLDACAEGACCETDGTCSIKPQCECDTDNGAVFAGVGETCEACDSCVYRHLGVSQSLVNFYDRGLSIGADSLFEVNGRSFSTTERPPDNRFYASRAGGFWFNYSYGGPSTLLRSLFAERSYPAYVIEHYDGCSIDGPPPYTTGGGATDDTNCGVFRFDTRSRFTINFCHSETEARVTMIAEVNSIPYLTNGRPEKIQFNGEDINTSQPNELEINFDMVYPQDDNPFNAPGTLSFHFIDPERVVRFVIKQPLVQNQLP